MQKIQVIGNIGQVAKINDHNGRKAISFSVAVNRKYVDKDGVTHENTTWFNCTKWVGEGRSTEIAKYLLPGTKVYVEGIPSVSTWTNKENKTFASQNIDAREIELLGSKKESEAAPDQSQSTEEIQPNTDFENQG